MADYFNTDRSTVGGSLGTQNDPVDLTEDYGGDGDDDDDDDVNQNAVVRSNSTTIHDDSYSWRRGKAVLFSPCQDSTNSKNPNTPQPESNHIQRSNGQRNSIHGSSNCMSMEETTGLNPCYPSSPKEDYVDSASDVVDHVICQSKELSLRPTSISPSNRIHPKKSILELVPNDDVLQACDEGACYFYQNIDKVWEEKKDDINTSSRTPDNAGDSSTPTYSVPTIHQPTDALQRKLPLHESSQNSWQTQKKIADECNYSLPRNSDELDLVERTPFDNKNLYEHTHSIHQDNRAVFETNSSVPAILPPSTPEKTTLTFNSAQNLSDNSSTFMYNNLVQASVPIIPNYSACFKDVIPNVDHGSALHYYANQPNYSTIASTARVDASYSINPQQSLVPFNSQTQGSQFFSQNQFNGHMINDTQYTESSLNSTSCFLNSYLSNAYSIANVSQNLQLNNYPMVSQLAQFMQQCHTYSSLQTSDFSSPNQLATTYTEKNYEVYRKRMWNQSTGSAHTMTARSCDRKNHLSLRMTSNHYGCSWKNKNKIASQSTNIRSADNQAGKPLDTLESTNAEALLKAPINKKRLLSDFQSGTSDKQSSQQPPKVPVTERMLHEFSPTINAHPTFVRYTSGSDISVNTKCDTSKHPKDSCVSSGSLQGESLQMNQAQHRCDKVAPGIKLLTCKKNISCYLQFEGKAAVENWRPLVLAQRPKSMLNPILPPCMTNIEHLSKKTCSIDNLPLWNFTVYGGDDDILYYFSAFIQESRIPGAGYGAFLTFLGAKRLKQDSKRVQHRLWTNTYVQPSLEPRTLQAVLEKGSSGITVHVTSSELYPHGQQFKSMTNLVAFINETTLRPESLLKNGKQSIRVYGGGLPSDIDRKGYFVSDPNRRIGFLGIHIESDYRWDNNVHFPANSDCICLGRYGPFRVADRKTDDLFVMKAFIFSLEPTEWGYSVEESIHGCLQIIDITSDSTGQPHELAKQNIPMYVNEVGYNTSLKQNVYICEENDRVVQYFFRSEQSLKKGDTVELLTNYRDSYEKVRERKGYGWRNMHEGCPGDENLAQKLQRNFIERVDVVMIINAQENLQTLSKYLSFIHREIWIPINSKIVSFLSTGSSLSPFLANRWVAIRRIQWLMDVIQQKVELHRSTPTRHNLLSQLLVFNMLSIINTIKSEGPDMHIFDKRTIVDSLGMSVNQALSEEIIEEMGYCLQDDLPMFMDSSVYCPIGRKLIEKLCSAVATSLPFKRSKTDNDIESMKTLYDRLVNAALSGKKEVREAVRCFKKEGLKSDLIFTSGFHLKSSLSGPIEKLFDAMEPCPSFFLDNSIIPKGFKAALMQKLGYLDALLLAGLECHNGQENSLIKIDQVYVMVKFSGLESHIQEQELSSIPRSVEKTLSSSCSINETWFYIWQVFWPVHVFASKFLNSSVYSYDDLCHRLGLDVSLGRYAISRGMKCRPEDIKRMKLISQLVSSHPSKLKNNSSIKQKNNKATTINGHSSKNSVSNFKRANLIYEGPVKKFPSEFSSYMTGWIQKTFVRVSGASINQTDDYWYTPVKRYKLRSLAQIRRFMTALLLNNGDEDNAIKSR